MKVGLFRDTQDLLHPHHFLLNTLYPLTALTTKMARFSTDYHLLNALLAMC